MARNKVKKEKPPVRLLAPVSYTHLTLPTILHGENTGAGEKIKKKQKEGAEE